jgi:hypothetical protein
MDHEDSMSNETELEKSQIISVEKFLSVRSLAIPGYQRPYKWGTRNIAELLTDIENAIADSKKYGESFHYRIGTIILHDNKHGDDNKDKRTLDLVDGQQRCISLLLLKLYLEPGFEKCNLLHAQFTDPATKQNIHDNYKFIENWFAAKGAVAGEARMSFNAAFSTNLQVVVLVVKNLPEAFQLFDSQNSRGRELDPHDLLKAYHLREMHNDPFEMRRAVARWEKAKPDDIKKLFNDYLFPILNWARKESTRPFTDDEIDAYKGISNSLISSYPFAKRTLKAMPVFQITEDFMAGKDFFDMVDYYLQLLKYVQAESKAAMQKLLREDEFNKVYNSSGTGLRYALRLFECAVLCYYDRFKNFETTKKLFTWALMIRADMERLSFDTVNRYARGIIDGRYSNNLPMFSKITRAGRHTELATLTVNVLWGKEWDSHNENWTWLHKALKKLNGYKPEANLG